jgi:hypothetical protein
VALKRLTVKFHKVKNEQRNPSLQR